MLSSTADSHSALIGAIVSAVCMAIFVICAALCKSDRIDKQKAGLYPADPSNTDNSSCHPFFAALGSITYLWYASIGGLIVLAVGQGVAHWNAISRVGTEFDRGTPPSPPTHPPPPPPPPLFTFVRLLCKIVTYF
jgi:hypothetical protein